MTPLDSLKAGIKTAVVVFLTALVSLLVLAITEALDWINSSGTDVIDWSNMRKVAIAAAVALAVGVLNALLRFVQVAGVPFIGKLVDKVLGAVPAYPEQNVDKVVPALPSPMEAAMVPARPNTPKEG